MAQGTLFSFVHKVKKHLAPSSLKWFLSAYIALPAVKAQVNQAKCFFLCASLELLFPNCVFVDNCTSEAQQKIGNAIASIILH